MKHQKIKVPGKSKNVAVSKSCTDNKPLSNQSIYLDFVCYPKTASLEKNLRLLGATVERCFSRDVTTVVTDREASIDHEQKRSNAHSNLPSPINANLFGAKKYGKQSYVPNAPSPLCHSSPACSPCADVPCQPVTRGQAIAQKANLTKHYGSTNVMERARQWNIRIVNVKKVEKWVDKELEKIEPTAKVKPPKAKVHKLSEPYIKVEDVHHCHRPQIKRLTSAPSLSLHAFLGLSVFEQSSAGAGRDRSGSSQEQLTDKEVIIMASKHAKNISDKTNRKSDKKSHSLHRKLTKRHHILSSRLKSKSKCLYGYCELCESNYEDVNTHRQSLEHNKRLANDSLFEPVDKLIEDGLSLYTLLERSNAPLSVSPFRSGRLDGCDESPCSSVILPRIRSGKWQCRTRILQQSPCNLSQSSARTSVSIDSSTVLCDQNRQVRTSGRISPEIPIMWPSKKRIRVDSQNIRQLVIRNDYSNPSVLNTATCREIPCISSKETMVTDVSATKPYSAIDLKRDTLKHSSVEFTYSTDLHSQIEGNGVVKSASTVHHSSSVVQDIGVANGQQVTDLSDPMADCISLCSSPSTDYESMYDDEIRAILFGSSSSASFNGFTDFSESESGRVSALSDMELISDGLDSPSGSVVETWHSGQGIGPRQTSRMDLEANMNVDSTADLELMTVDVNRISDGLKTVLPTSDELEQMRSFVSLIPLSEFTLGEINDHCDIAESVWRNYRNCTVTSETTPVKDKPATCSNVCVYNVLNSLCERHASSCFNVKVILSKIVCDRRTQPIQCSENLANSRMSCLPPTPYSLASGCSCWQPVLSLPKLNSSKSEGAE